MSFPTGLNLHREDELIRQARMKIWERREPTPTFDLVLSHGLWIIELQLLSAVQLRGRMDSLGVKGSRKNKSEMINALVNYWTNRLQGK